MQWRWRRTRPEDWEELRAHMIAETSLYLTECLRHPEWAVRIPVIPAGTATFPPSLTPAFWDRVLFD